MIEDSQGMPKWRDATTEYVEASQEGACIANRLLGRCALKADDARLLWIRTCCMHIQSIPVSRHFTPMRNCLEVVSAEFPHCRRREASCLKAIGAQNVTSDSGRKRQGIRVMHIRMKGDSRCNFVLSD